MLSSSRADGTPRVALPGSQADAGLSVFVPTAIILRFAAPRSLGCSVGRDWYSPWKAAALEESCGQWLAPWTFQSTWRISSVGKINKRLFLR